ncbi:MAG: hypothetical protein AAF483_29760, partial [Planctomycetota bacterium]
THTHTPQADGQFSRRLEASGKPITPLCPLGLSAFLAWIWGSRKNRETMPAIELRDRAHSIEHSV